MNGNERSETARKLLESLLRILESEKESNWIRGVRSALAELNSNTTTAAFENARSIYKTMTSGGRGLSEFFVWSDDEDERLHKNLEIDKLRAELWDVFDL